VKRKIVGLMRFQVELMRDSGAAFEKDVKSAAELRATNNPMTFSQVHSQAKQERKKQAQREAAQLREIAAAAAVTPAKQQAEVAIASMYGELYVGRRYRLGVR
jgi:hypothetical protein